MKDMKGVKGGWLKLVGKPGEKVSMDVVADIALSTKDNVCVRCKQPLGEGADCEVCETVTRSEKAAVINVLGEREDEN